MCKVKTAKFKIFKGKITTVHMYNIKINKHFLDQNVVTLCAFSTFAASSLKSII